MSPIQLFGALVVVVAGLSAGSAGWPLKTIRRLRLEHWLFVFAAVGLVILPWAVTITLCPHFVEALRTLDPTLLIRSNLFALGWGVANVLCGVCCVRIGFAITGGVLGGLGLSLGVTIPLILKGTGVFSHSPNIASPAGYAVLAGAAVIVVAVTLVAAAGFGRERCANPRSRKAGFAGGLVMSIVAGVLSTGPVFAFAYSQGPIVDALTARGASEIAARFSVWAVGMPAGALVNLAYAAYLITRDRTWRAFRAGGIETAMCAASGVQFGLAFGLLGNGSLLLGPLGVSVGWGIYQAMQVLGCQGVAVISGEWRGVDTTSRRRMGMAVALLILGSAVLALGNRLS